MASPVHNIRTYITTHAEILNVRGVCVCMCVFACLNVCVCARACVCT